ncbi:MAG: toprim domain-containing protein [Cetobacterium sp.]
MIINNNYIPISIEQVLFDIKQANDNKIFKDIKNCGDYLLVTCPFHKNGQEHTPSMGISLKQIKTKDGVLEEGFAHCFGCGYKGTFTRFVGDVQGINEYEALRFLKSYAVVFKQDKRHLEVGLEREKFIPRVENINNPMTANVLNYLAKKRGLHTGVLKAYDIGSNGTRAVFPIKNKDGQVLAYQQRDIYNKQFYNTKDFDKLSNLYGLYELKKYQCNDNRVFIVESIIDCLTLRGWGYNSVALMGVILSDYHLKELCKLSLDIVLALDNDEEGKKAINIIKQRLLTKGKRVQVVQWDKTTKKDINALKKEEFLNLI